jgi:hypothetical protein
VAQSLRGEEMPALMPHYDDGLGRRVCTREGQRRTDGQRDVRPGGECGGSTWQRGTPRGVRRTDRGSKARLSMRVRRRVSGDAWRQSGVRDAVARATSRVPARHVSVHVTLTTIFSRF